MEPPAAYGARERPPSGAARPSSSPPAFGPEDFPGCEPFHLPAAELDDHEGRLEFWDGRTQTAWRVSEGASVEHEEPVGMLPYAMREFAALRGSPVKCFGSARLVRRDASGCRRWLMQADQVLYLHPGRSRPYGPEIDVDRGPLPDVVLEVDCTTDVRRRKLGIYREAGFPELWVLVPPGSSRAGRPRLTIHVLDGKGYRTAPESRAFPGWKREEIYGALMGDPWSDSTHRAVDRVARAMGAREGTGPEDDPLSRSLLREGRARRRSERHAQGREEGEAWGRAAMVREVLRSRGIEVSPDFAEALPALAEDTPAEALVAAALACTEEADFLRRVRTLDPAR